MWHDQVCVKHKVKHNVTRHAGSSSYKFWRKKWLWIPNVGRSIVTPKKVAPTFVIDSRWSMVYHSFLVNSISGVSCLFSCSAGPGSSACRAAAGFEEGIGRTPGAAGWPARGGSHGGGALAEQGPCPHWTSLSGRRQRAGLGPPCLLVRRGVGAERRGLVSFATAAVFCFLPWLRSGWWLRSTTYKYRTHRTPRIWIAIGLEHNRRLLEPYF